MKCLMWFFMICFFTILQAQNTLYFEDNMGAPMYKKCTFIKTDNKEKVIEKWYVLQKESNNAILMYKYKILFENHIPVEQTLINYRLANSTFINLRTSRIKIEIQKEGNKKKIFLEKPKKIYVPLMGRIYKHSKIFDIGKTFSIEISPMPLGRLSITKHNVEILPKATIPNSKTKKQYFVAKITESSNPDIKRTIYYDENRFVVYSIGSLKKNIFVRKRVDKKKNLIFSNLYYKINDIEKMSNQHCNKIKYKHSYPENWTKKETTLFNSIYAGKSGSVGVILSKKKKINNAKAFTNHILKIMKNQQENCRYTKIKFREHRQIVIKNHGFTETIIKCVYQNQYRYFVIMATTEKEHNYAIVLYGNEKQFKKNYPTWYYILHSFFIKMKS